MTPSRRPRSRTAVAAADGRLVRAWLATLLLLAAALLATVARADDPAPADGQKVIKTYGIVDFGDLKYPADFKHFNFVNPDAPQGGTMTFRGTGASQTFDSLNLFILKGEPAQGLGLLYDSLLTGSPTSPTPPTG